MPEQDQAEAEEIVRAIGRGEVDAFVVREAAEDRIYSLRSADVLYRAMIEEMKDGAVALDASGLIVYCNAYFAELVKTDRGTLVGKRISGFVPGGNGFFDLRRDGMRAGTSRRELALRARDGTTVPVLASMNRFRLDDTDVYCLIVTDLSEQKRRDQLVVEGRRKDEFLAMLAHELRNPIAPIRYAAERLGASTLTPARLKWAQEIIERQVDQLTHLVDDLLDVSRITRGKIVLQAEALEVEDVVTRAVEAVRPLIEARKQVLVINHAAPGLRVHGDVTRLAQAVSNLLNNAAKFTAEGGEIRVRVEQEKPEERARGQAVDWVRIVVSDDGVGIAPGTLPELFNLFAQGNTTQGRSHGGLGIGLTLVRSFVEMHQGTVVGSSDGPGRGSTFTVRLPLLPRAAAAETSSQNARAATAGPAVTPRRILVVDDNPDVAESLSQWLADDGHAVRVATSGESALREARGFRPEIVFVDIGLPDLSGHEVARRLRALPGLRATVLIAVTGYGREQDRLRSREAGFDEHWIKPLTAEALSGLFASLDARSKAAAAPRRPVGKRKQPRRTRPAT